MKDFDFNLVKRQSIDFRQIEMTARKADKSLASSILLKETDPESSFTLAYESMLKISLALMLSRGYRPRVQLGHHKTLVEFSKYVLGNEFIGLTSTYAKMRSKRNKVVYDTKSVSLTEAAQAVNLAGEYIDAVKRKIDSENPQLKLFQ